jgi:hypothetical protein
VRGYAAAERYKLIVDGDGTVAIWQISQRVWANGVGAGMVAVGAPAAEVIQSKRVSAVESENAADLPVANDSVNDRVGVVVKLLTAADRQLVSEIASEDVSLVVVAGSPVSLRVIDVLPIQAGRRNSARQCCPSQCRSSPANC